MQMNGKTTVFNAKEKLLLERLVKENNAEFDKNKAWEKIAVTYNSQCEVRTPRTSKQLRKLWHNFNDRKRKETVSDGMLITYVSPAKKPMLDSVLQVAEYADANINLEATEQAEVRRSLEESVPGCSLELEDEGLQIRKLKMAIEQQQELYKLKKELTELQLLKVNEELKKATDDAELSSLKLQQFKEQMASAKQENPDIEENDNLNGPTSTSTPVRERDECDIFGEYIAAKLRHFDSHTRAIVEYQISKILFDAEMGRLDDNYMDNATSTTEQ